MHVSNLVTQKLTWPLLSSYAEAIVGALNSGLSQQIVQPALMNILPFTSRGPAWFKRLIEITGKTDTNITDETAAVAIRQGYKSTF